MPPRTMKKNPAGTPTPKRAAVKTLNKTPKSANKTPPRKREPEIVQNVEKPEEAAPAEAVKVLEVPVPVKEAKSLEAGKLKKRSSKDVAAVEKSTPVNESAPKKDAEEDAKPSFDEDDKGERMGLDDNEPGIRGARLEMDDNEPESEPEEDDEGRKDETAAMDLDEDDIAQEDEEEGLEDQLDEGEHEVDEGGDEEEEGDGEDMEGVGEEEELGEEHDEQHEVVKENYNMR